jgi:hypothetical protein
MAVRRWSLRIFWGLWFAILINTMIWGRPGSFVSSLVFAAIMTPVGFPFAKWWLAGRPLIGGLAVLGLLIFAIVVSVEVVTLLRYLRWIGA